MASSAINIAIGTFAVEKSLTTDLINRIIANTRAEIADLTNFVLIGDKEGVVNLIYNQKASHKDLAYLLVLDANSSLVASTLINQDADTIIKYNRLANGQNQQVTLVKEDSGEQVYDIALRLDYNQGVLIAGYYKNQIDQSVRNVVYLLALGALSALAIALLFAFLFTRAFFKPLDNLKVAVEKVAAGDLKVQAKVTSRDELGFLALAFNQMTAKLKSSYEGLEEKVREKTSQLSDKLQEIESSNKKLEKTQVALGNLLQDEKELQSNLQRDRDRMSAIFSSMAEGVLVVDNEGKILLLNSVAEQLLEIKADKALGKNLTQLYTMQSKNASLPFEKWPSSQVLVSHTKAFSVLEDDLNLQLPSGKKLPVIMGAAPVLEDNQVVGVVVVFRDVSREKKLDDAKTGFISIASHQLRTPLTSMRWFSEMLIDGDAGQISEEQKHFVERIYEGANRMIDLVNLLLQIARVEAGRVKISPVPVDLKATTQGVLITLKTYLDKKNQKVEIATTPEKIPSIPMDHEVIWQVIQNLLSNASRYSPESATIFVEAVVKGDQIQYSVKDSGIGIPENQKERIFEKFFRTDNALQAVPEGSGLGLNLVKSLVDEWGGKVWFESRVGAGTTFFFTVPLAGQQAKEGEVGLAV